MEILYGPKSKNAQKYVKIAKEAALNSTCLRAHCGAVIVNNNQVIGKGYNSPPQDDENNRMCQNMYKNSNGKKQKYDKTCCIHAEWRAITNALIKYPESIKGSTLYFMRIENGKPLQSEPFCTVCSRLITDVGIKKIVLWQKEGYIEYDASEYNQVSYAFFL
jgi:dCMP deaminase